MRSWPRTGSRSEVEITQTFDNVGSITFFIATVDQTGTGNLTSITQQDQGAANKTATATCSPSYDQSGTN